MPWFTVAVAAGLQVVPAVAQLVAKLERARCHASRVRCVPDVRRSQS